MSGEEATLSLGKDIDKPKQAIAAGTARQSRKKNRESGRSKASPKDADGILRLKAGGTTKKKSRFKPDGKTSTRRKITPSNQKDHRNQSKEGSEARKGEPEDPFPGDAPIPTNVLRKHKRDSAEYGNLRKTIKNPRKRVEVWRREKQTKFAAQQAARTEMLLPEECGFIEAEEDEVTSQFTQTEIKGSVDITSAAKQFDLALQFGPYSINYSRNGRKMLIGGRKGHVAAFDWVTKDLTCEMNVMESVHDVAWLHNETMFAVAQKNWTYIYDNQGIEVHCIKKMDHVLKMEFLPYHFILASSTDKGWLHWLDVSIGKMVKQTPTRLGRLGIMCQNPSNAVLCCGHSKGTVTMWTPNTEEAVVKMLCHRQPVRAVAVDPSGLYMATSAVDASLKIWDLRTYKCLNTFRMGCGASHLAFSQKQLLGVSLGNIVEVYKDICTEQVRHPYLKHRLGSTISGLEFCPFEDALGVSHDGGMCSMLVPGAGEPNFDALESNPFQTKTQRRESEVKSLLEKIQPEFITLDPGELGDVDRPTVQETFEARTRYMFVKPKKIDLKPRKNAKTATLFHIKQSLQEQERKNHVAAAKTMQQLDEASDETEKSTKPAVLDRFKPKPKKKAA